MSATLAHSGTFRHDPVPRTVSREVEYQEAVRASRQAAKRRKLTRQRWQWEWVENLTDELRTADHMGNLRRVYQIHRQLGIRRSLFQSSSAVPAPADPVNERAAWKEHFRILQAGRETVQETVWTNVKAEPLQDWLSAPPTDEEILACGSKMKNGKAAGLDGFKRNFISMAAPFYKLVSAISFVPCGPEQQEPTPVKKPLGQLVAGSGNPPLETKR